MSFLTGKKASSSSSNQAYPWLQQTYSPQAQQGVQANNFLGSLLGVGGDPSQANAAYDQFKNASGYQNILGEAMRGVTNSAAGRGLLSSGATARGLQTTAGNLAQSSFGNFLQQLQGLSSSGIQAGGLIAQGGQQSSQKGGSGGLLGAAGTALSVLSDRRAKENIRKVGSFPDGLGIYDFTYKGTKQKMRGVMADEVETLRPWALGPIVRGYRTVNYEAL